jgi:probable phosphoglycerate mutase
MGISTNGKRIFIARHGETVFNVVAKMQGQQAVHTPLTRFGFAQADHMGAGLARYLTQGDAVTLWSSTSGRALQTLAVIAEHIGANWHQTRVDARLQEIDVGLWSGRTYSEIAAEIGHFVDAENRLFSVRAPQGEWYDDVAARLKGWIDDVVVGGDSDLVVLMHGMSARVLRGLLLGMPAHSKFDAPIAPSLPQGSMVMIKDGVEELVVDGDGAEERA